jgi:hypothetical protein
MVRLVVVALLLLAPAAARAQEAHCSWLKLKATGKGYEIDDEETVLGVKRSVKADCYAQLVWAAPGGEFPNGRYTAPLVCLHGANDAWQATDADNGLSIRLLGDGNGATDDDYLTFHGVNGDVIQGYASHLLVISLDKEGAFKKASWRTLGAQLIDGSTYFRTPSTVLGGYAASGSTVAEEKVPEGARALMSPGMCD